MTIDVFSLGGSDLLLSKTNFGQFLWPSLYRVLVLWPSLDRVVEGAGGELEAHGNSGKSLFSATLGKFLKIRYPKLFSYGNLLNKILIGIFSINLFGIFGFEKFT